MHNPRLFRPRGPYDPDDMYLHKHDGDGSFDQDFIPRARVWTIAPVRNPAPSRPARDANPRVSMRAIELSKQAA